MVLQIKTWKKTIQKVQDKQWLLMYQNTKSYDMVSDYVLQLIFKQYILLNFGIVSNRISPIIQKDY